MLERCKPWRIFRISSVSVTLPALREATLHPQRNTAKVPTARKSALIGFPWQRLAGTTAAGIALKERRAFQGGCSLVWMTRSNPALLSRRRNPSLTRGRRDADAPTQVPQSCTAIQNMQQQGLVSRFTPPKSPLCDLNVDHLLFFSSEQICFSIISWLRATADLRFCDASKPISASCLCTGGKSGCSLMPILKTLTVLTLERVWAEK